MKSPPYLVYLVFALKVNCASVQFIHNKVTLKAVNHSQVLVLFYMNAHVPFLQHSSTEIEIGTCPKCKSLIQISIKQQVDFC